MAIPNHGNSKETYLGHESFYYSMKLRSFEVERFACRLSNALLTYKDRIVTL
jgi:hypothetical protein